VAYALSAASLSVPPRAAGTGPAVVIGDPHGDLPGARREVIEVARILGSAPRLGHEATRAVVRGAANAWLLHVAAHTDAASNGPAIHLADGLLDAASVLEWPSAPRLVVLLGCSSARAKGRDELAPLTAAFLAAGSHTVVASLWAVDDTIAHRFAHELYRAGGTKDPIGALAKAQRALMQRGAPEAQWSTFVVVGGLRDHKQGDR
jgi:CHAT domain-containing protein